MTRIVVRELVWDKYNFNHIKKHKVSGREVENAGGNLIYHKRSYKERYLLIGRTGSRLLTLVLKRISTGKYYPITARDSSKRERKVVYEKEKK